MNVITKLGGIPKVYKILVKQGWNYSISALRMQISRGSLSRDVCVILADFMNKNKISYSVNDFYLESDKGEE